MSIRVEALTKCFGSQRAVNSVSFTVNKGEIVGFIGPNGSGKSTTMKCICGIIPANEGTVFVDDINVQDDTLTVKKHLGYLPEHNPLHTDMYVKEYLEHIDAFYSQKKGRKHRIAHMIELTGLSREQNKKIGQLSKGFKQRVGLAQALIHDPDVLVLDEPTTGLDPNQLVEIRTLISGLSKEKTVLLSTHILQEVEAICDRVIVINQGSIVADGTSEYIKSSKNEPTQIIYIELGTSVDPEILRKIDGVYQVQQINDHEFLLAGYDSSDIRERIFQYVKENNLALLTIQKKEESLEQAFKKLTSQ
jgi:ABC-2 type transport system ATP-binding protein